MSSIAVSQPARIPAEVARGGARRALMLLAVLAALWGLWEGWRGLGVHYGISWPFPVNDVTMPHLHSIVRQLFAWAARAVT